MNKPSIESPLTDQDLKQLRSAGISESEALRQLSFFASPPPTVELDRPCRTEDGILQLSGDEEARYERLFESAQRAGRCMKMVPASGAASRMFKSLAAKQGSGVSYEELNQSQDDDTAAASVVRFIDSLDRFAFADALRALPDFPSDVRGQWQDVLERFLGEKGLNYAALPKGLLLFHRYPDKPRTALEEHLIEAVGYVRDDQGRCRLHFTVSPEHRSLFESLVDSVRSQYEENTESRFDIEYSVQDPSTDTLAVDEQGRPFRKEDGSLLLRPGGHGALIFNLNRLQADIVFIKNIDNVVPDALREPTLRYKRILGGVLLELQQKIFKTLEDLDSAGDEATLSMVRDFIESRLGVALEPTFEGLAANEKKQILQSLLDRPLRVCGVVRNQGEPGGGPFWVRQSSGRKSLQIVESAQIDAGDKSQTELFAGSTHFNPVDLVCACRDRHAKSFDLTEFVDPNAVFIASKSFEGRPLKALERPGLWNGGMARWNTAFVEVPLETFNPVKTVLDLLRPQHQA